MDFFKRLSGRRVFTELRQLLEEENPTPAIIRLQDYDLLRVIHPSVILDNELISLLNSVKEVMAWHDLLFLEESYIKWAVYFMALIRHCDFKTSSEICERLELAPRYVKYFTKDRFDTERILYQLQKRLPVKNSRLYEMLSGLKIEMILYMMVIAGSRQIKRAISHYVTKLRYVDITITGKDLMKLGLEPGPAYRSIMQEVLNSKLNGKLETRKDELEYIQKYSKK
jgi:tRNA nucleotidyltransferase (CCA-adding enzyme)